MVIQCVQYTFAPEDAKKAEAILGELRDACRTEAGVIKFEVARNQENPNVFVLWEEYQDQAALETHRTMEHFDRLVLNGIRPLAQQRAAAVLSPI